MNARNKTRTVLTLVAVAVATLGLTATSAKAGTISYVGITGDADCGISADNIYTHTLDFGTGTPGALINGVQFDAYNAAANGTLNFNRTAVSGTLNDHAGNGNHNVTGNLVNLMTDMYYNGNNAVGGVTTWTLSGLTAGQTYHTRIYTRMWGPDDNRNVTFVFDPDGAGPVSDTTGKISQDNATSMGFANGNDAYYINYQFKAVAGEDLVITLTQDNLNYSWHLYGLTNQEFSPETAISPDPKDEATDVFRDTLLSWTAGTYAAAHDVYFGESYDDVSVANADNDLGVLLSPGQTATTFDPERLELGKTYFWRVDEVNAAPDYTVFPGKVWSFTVEPVAYAIEGISVTYSGISLPGSGPENTINGSGLNDDDQHSMELEDMWLSLPAGAGPDQLVYEFDKAYSLYEMWVWNSNIEGESMIGFGAKDVTVEYSTDGADWTLLGEEEFAQGAGENTYTANTAVPFGGAIAQYVRLTINSNWISPTQHGLAEVRFLYVPLRARKPQPAVGATEVHPDVSLSWRPGRQGDRHDLYLDTDEQAVIDGTASAVTVPESTHEVQLDLGQIYYWKVNEANDLEDPATWEGDVWSFSTMEWLVVDDFESYTNYSPNRVFQTWIDGAGFSADPFFPDGHDGNGSGSLVGYDPLAGDIMETTVVQGGGKSMPLYYDNTSDPFYSEAGRTWTEPQDWTVSGVQSLSLFFRGASDNNGGQLYVKINNAKVSYDVDPVTLSRAIWHPWTIDLSTVGANLSNVSSLTIGIEGAGAAGVVYIDSVRLYPSLDPHDAFKHIPVFSATASSSLGGNFNRMDALCIDGSGLNPDGSHTVTPDGFMWLNNGVFAAPHDLEPEIVFDLGAVYSVDTMLVWNYNEVGDFTKRGISTADILIASEDGVFSTLIENQAFDEAPGTGDVDFHQTIDLNGAKARFIKLDISANHGGDNDFVGLSEVQFEGTLSP